MTVEIIQPADGKFFCDDSAGRPIVVAVSTCLTGAAVRYDGDSKPLATLLAWPAAGVTLLPICPEVGAGLSVPRPPVQLVASDGGWRALGCHDPGLDVTEPLATFADRSLAALRQQADLCGYVWKSRSPSCGFGSTPLFDASGQPCGSGDGIQAHAITTALPWLVHIEETRLQSPIECAQFLLQCRLVADLREALVRGATLAAWHRHYAFLVEMLPSATGSALAALATAVDWRGYLTLLHRSCERVEAEQMLGLFAVSALSG